jgi:hypothetical protein
MGRSIVFASIGSTTMGRSMTMLFCASMGSTTLGRSLFFCASMGSTTMGKSMLLSTTMGRLLMGYSNYYPHPPLLRNLGISRGGGALTLEFPGERVH